MKHNYYNTQERIRNYRKEPNRNSRTENYNFWNLNKIQDYINSRIYISQKITSDLENRSIEITRSA